MGISKGIKSALTDHREKMRGPHFFFSVKKAIIDKNELNLDSREVITHLTKAGYDTNIVNSNYGSLEKSIAIYGVSKEQAEKLHQMVCKLGYGSSIYSDGKNEDVRVHHTTEIAKSESVIKNYKEFKKGDDSLKACDKIPDSYKEEAEKGFDILFRVKIKGEEFLTDDIYLHMSLKIFKNKKEFDVEELKEIVKKYNIAPPPVKDLKFKTTIFKSERNGQEYHMLMIEGLDSKYKKLYDHFKDVGTVYKKFLAHVTINKAIYDDIEKNGIEPKDIEFGPLMLEAGPGNTICEFEKSEELKKGIKSGLASVALGIASLAPNMAGAQKPAKNNYSTQKMLRTIASVESNNGQNVQHKPTSRGTAYGKFALMPDTIHETIKRNPKLKSKYGKGVNLNGEDLNHYMQDNPGLEDQIAEQHLKRLEHHFGQDPKKLGFGWNQGITGTNRALKEKKDIDSHPYTKKIVETYSKEK